MKEQHKDILRKFQASVDCGFLPEDRPLTRLPDDYFEPWESAANNLAELISSNQIQARIDTLPVLGVDRLETEADWRRAYSVLGFLAHAYIWGGSAPSEVSARSFVPCLTLTRVATPSPDHLPAVIDRGTFGPDSDLDFCRNQSLEF
jgi:indoleamine 2,3-dioxygenase